MPGHIPALYAEGAFTFLAPFSTVITPNVILKCLAIRSFEDVYNEGIDVFTAYYDPHEISAEDFEADRKNRISIITLTKIDGTYYHVPSSYIGLIPSGDTVPYSHVVVSVSIGAIPNNLDLSALKDAIGETVSSTIGVTGAVHENRAPSLLGSVVTSAQHATMETARLAAVTNATTYFAENIRLQKLVESLQDTIASYETYLIANPPP